jgi:hypothetical protein
MPELEPTRGPNRALAAAVALGVLAVAAVLSGPIFGPPAASPSPSPSPAAATEAPDRWAALRRPLALPSVGLDGSCPSTGVVLRSADLAPLPWPGRVVPFGAFHAGRLYYDEDSARWDSLSLFWVGDGQARDALVRGRSLDGTMDVGFGDGLDPLLEMQLDGAETQALVPGWSLFHADVTRVQRPGCYGLQIDTATDSTLVVFEARHAAEAVVEMLERPLTRLDMPPDACSQVQPGAQAPFGALGEGPVFLALQNGSGTPAPISLSQEPSQEPAQEPSQDGWRRVGRLSWLIDPRYRGPVVIRSATAAQIRFGGTSDDRAALELPVTSFIHGDEEPGWRNFISDAWVREPGCYAMQVDLLTGSSAFAAFQVVP